MMAGLLLQQHCLATACLVVLVLAGSVQCQPQRASGRALLDAAGAAAPAPAPQAAAPADAFDGSSCPAWLKEYEAWHAATRTAPSARFLVAEAPGFVGVGDHLRGMMYALRVAAATRRVLLLHWEHPGNLTDFLVPATRINWRLDGTPAARLARALSRPSADLDVLTNGDIGRRWPRPQQWFEADPSNKTILVLKTNFPAEQFCAACPQVHGRPASGWGFVCLFRYLFKPSPLVEAATDEHLAAMYAQQQPVVYAAVHLRLGHMRGEDSTINRIAGVVDPLAKLLLSVSCGRAMAAQAGINISASPMLLLADHRGIRHFAQHGKLAHVVAPRYDAVHTKVNSFDGHLLSFVDLNLLARARCLVTSHSGFSNVAWWMSGGNSCRMMLGECYAACERDPGGPFCN